jgi:peptidoglycan/xylan/chitin deacetylase (PgdA/CDA1 family)
MQAALAPTRDLRRLRRLARRAVERLIAAIGPGYWRLTGPRLIVLTYHRVLPAFDPRARLVQPGMIVHPETLRMHLHEIGRRFEFVHLHDWLSGRARDGARVTCAVTFDDGWRDNYEFALPVLAEAGVPATVFLVSDLVGTRHSFWPERLARVLWNRGEGLRREQLAGAGFEWLAALTAPATGVSPGIEAIDDAIMRAKRLPDAEIERLLAPVEGALGLDAGADSPDLLDWEQVRAMLESGLLAFGSHSRRHRRLLEQLDPAIVEDEVVNSKRAIEARTGAPVHLFCYPNGDVSPRARELVRQHYLGACTTESGHNRPGADPALLRRVSLHQDVCADPVAFTARLSGRI